jgi:hypothetical protein
MGTSFLVATSLFHLIVDSVITMTKLFSHSYRVRRKMLPLIGPEFCRVVLYHKSQADQPQRSYESDSRAMVQ